MCECLRSDNFCSRELGAHLVGVLHLIFGLRHWQDVAAAALAEELLLDANHIRDLPKVMKCTGYIMIIV